MARKQRVSNIPALKDGARWILAAEDKANRFAETFEKKNEMIEEEANEFSMVFDAHVQASSPCLPTVEATEEILKALDEDSALGPDFLPTRILKRCAHALAPVFHMLLLAILKVGK